MELAKALALIALVGTSSAQAGAQTVVDGDTFKLNGTTYRVWGIDAPEAPQVCLDGWRAGLEATKALANLISNRVIVCERRDTDRFNRSVAVCRTNGQDIGAAMVSAGLAYAFKIQL
jgi:endonuclease YncB( thermonuclease family)